MSAVADATPQAAAPSTLDWGLIRRQIVGILRRELGRNLLSMRALALYFLAFAPVAMLAVWSMTPFPEEFLDGPAAAAALFANLFPFYLRIAVFLSSIFLFTNLFRAEILEKSLHYYLLCPVRREVLVAGKYTAALIAACLTFVVSTSALFFFMVLPWGGGELTAYMLRGPGLGILLTYLGIAVLGCAGYGAVFLLVGQLFRNPLVPAVGLWVWEFINFLLPPLLKKISVVHYLRSLYPIPVAEGLFAVVAEPTPAWLSIPGMLLFTALVLLAAGWRARHMEITYGGE